MKLRKMYTTLLLLHVPYQLGHITRSAAKQQLQNQPRNFPATHLHPILQTKYEMMQGTSGGKNPNAVFQYV